MIHRASYVVRCWADEHGQMHAMLVDVRTGASHPVADVNGLPELLHELFEKRQALRSVAR